MVVDQHGNQQIIEATPREVITRKTPLCTNHFHILKDENRRVLDESLGRMEALETHWEDDHSVEKTFSLLNDPSKGVFVEDYRSWAGTIHTSAYIPKQLEAWMALGGNKDPVKLSFGDWLQGNDLSMKKLIGTINTDVGFIHMDHIRRNNS